MRVVVRGESLKRALRWTRHILFTGAFLAIGYCGFVLWDAWSFQQRQTASLERLPASTSEQPDDGLIGRIEIHRVGLSAMVVEGTDNTTLRRAAGHIHPGSGPR